MKKNFTILCLTLIIFTSNGQTIQKERKVVQVLPPATFTLNSEGRATLGIGNNITDIKIKLPPNTVEWCYVFQTLKDENNIKTKLFDQIMSMDLRLELANMTLKAVAGNGGTCNVYLIDANGKKYKQQTNYSSAIVKITDLTSNNLYLRFHNENSYNKVIVAYEVVAIVEETKNFEKSDEETKAEMFGGLGWKAYEKGEYDKCLELSLKALEYNYNIGWVHSNIGLVYLLKGNYISAIDSYSTAISLYRKTNNIQQTQFFFNESIKDINSLIAKFGKLEGTTEILEMLQREKQKY
ncbi:MAG: tetratricopeptide repeat protein [Prevotellaceae bacterium]|jgi:tetratricopeptide (TPR) repeat protein|nr:tetratricopeptide repeat protein [Prevotellaceae bacterium]